MNSLAGYGAELLIQEKTYDWGPMMRGWGFGGGWYWPAIMIGIIFVLIIAGVAVLVLRRQPGDGEGDTAIEILRKRYARGEISKEEFEEKKRDLGA